MADMFDMLPGLAAIRGAVIASSKVDSASILSCPGTGPHGTFIVSMSDGMVFRVDMTFAGADENAAAAEEEERPRDESDCRCGGMGEECPCEADGDDGLCACCRNGDCNGSCAAPGQVTG